MVPVWNGRRTDFTSVGVMFSACCLSAPNPSSLLGLFLFVQVTRCHAPSLEGAGGPRFQCVLFGAGFWSALWPAVHSTSPQTSSRSASEGGLPASPASGHISDFLHCSVSHGCALSTKVSVSGLVAEVLSWFTPCLGFSPQLWGSVRSQYIKFFYFLDFSLPLSSRSPVQSVIFYLKLSHSNYFPCSNLVWFLSPNWTLTDLGEGLS